MAEPWIGRTLSEDLLARAAQDWVHPSELLDIALRTGVSVPHDLRDLSIGLLARMLVEGMVVVGDVGDKHVPWVGTPGEVICRVIREWTERDDPFVMPGELFWVDTTSAGQAIGEAVLAREAQQRAP